MIAVGAFVFGAIVGSSGQGGTAAAPSTAPTVTVTATANADGKAAPTVTVTAKADGKPAATVTVTVTTKAESGNSSGESWGDGMHKVGTDIKPGKYVTTVPSDSIGCYYAILNSSDTQDIKTNSLANPGEKAYVTISSTDPFFESRGCGDWKKDN